VHVQYDTVPRFAIASQSSRTRRLPTANESSKNENAGMPN